MNQPIDLAQFKKDKPTSEEGTGQTGEPTIVETALLLIKQDGHWQVTPDLSVATKILAERVPDGQDIIAGLSVFLSDIQAEKTANMTLLLMNQMAQQQMQQMANAQVAAQIQHGIKRT